jgi:alpha-D-ribose 1-methylphosphonate 5-triphosphate synthase subunit PhnL
MSGGEKQKVNLVRGILAGARLLLLDEPTASLDLGSAELAFDLILARRAAGVAILAVVHGEHELKRLADFQVCLPSPAESEALAAL